MTESGYIKLYRRLHHGWMRRLTAGQRYGVIHLALAARWQNYPDKQRVGEHEVTVDRGELVTTQAMLADEIGISRSALRRLLQRCVENGFCLVNQTANRWTKISICNYGTYQGDKSPPDQPPDQPPIQPPIQPPLQPSIEELRSKKEDSRPPELSTPQPSLASLAQDATAWPDQVPWFQANLFWWDQVKDPDQFAVKVLDYCITEQGIPWPHLQEKLLDSSQFLEDESAKRKPRGTRGYYWNQVERYRYSQPEPVQQHQNRGGYSATEDWPEGVTFKSNGELGDISTIGQALPKALPRDVVPENIRRMMKPPGNGADPEVSDDSIQCT